MTFPRFNRILRAGGDKHMFTQLSDRQALVVQGKKREKNRLESQRRARKKYDAKNSRTASTKLTAAEREEWMKLCEREGITTHAALRRYILDCIDKRQLLQHFFTL